MALGLAALAGATVAGLAALLAASLAGVYLDRRAMPEMGPLLRFEFPTAGRIYDTRGQVLVELAREQRTLSRFDEIPPIVREAILAAEDRRFFSHDGIDYRSVPRVVSRIRAGTWLDQLMVGAVAAPGRAIFPQGGSTITQQLVRGVFLQEQVARERGGAATESGLASALTSMVGSRSASMMLRKHEEMRLAVWLEAEMARAFGSKRRAKEEILARYASQVYMGNGQYGFARAAEYYFGTPLASLGPDDADRAALLAAIMKSPRAYAPTAADRERVLRRRNQILALMTRLRVISTATWREATARPLRVEARPAGAPPDSAAVIEHVLDELRAHDLGLDDLAQGRVQVHTTVDLRVQAVVAAALEEGLARYERRHPGVRGLVQGAVVVLRNADGGVLAEAGGRRARPGHPSSFLDFNRARQSWRQPGSAMKPIVYLAAFRAGVITLDSLVPDEPTSVPDGVGGRKWIANYDGSYKGPLPARQALAESRNAVAIWITKRIGIGAVMAAARDLGLQAPLKPFVTTALGASEVTLVDLAGAYRALASGVVATPYVVHGVMTGGEPGKIVSALRLAPLVIADPALALVQEGLRGVVRLPSGTAHALGRATFPVAVMGKTGTTNDFRDAIFVGSTYGPLGITVAVRIGFDDNRSLGARETGGRVALPVFADVMAGIYQAQLVGPSPAFPAAMERSITRYLATPLPDAEPAAAIKE